MNSFKDIIGHGEIISLLAGALKGGRVSHAYLFSGPGGVGKTTTAMAFVKSLLCSEPQGGGACGLCRSCRQFESGNHPDLHYIMPDGATIKISQVRQLHEGVSLRPFQSTRQIFIISGAHSMTREAANSFLKVLEEPPAGVVFILISDNPQSLLSTISSRCQQVNFRPLSDQEIRTGLQRLKGISEEQSGLPSALAGGSLGQALELLENDTERNQVTSLLDKLDRAAATEVTFLAGELAGQEVNFQRFMDMLMLWYRDILMCKKGMTNLIVNRDHAHIINAKAHQLSVHRIIKNMKVVEQTKTKLAFRANTRLALEGLFFSLAGINDKEDLVQVGFFAPN